MSGTNTSDGLAAIARILKEARGHKSYRKFSRESGLSTATIKRLEVAEVDSPQDQTFEALARVTGRTFQELKAIARQDPTIEETVAHTAEDVMPLVNQLPRSELVRLAQMVVSRLGQVEVELPTVEEVQSAPLERVGELLRAIGDRLAQ